MADTTAIELLAALQAAMDAGKIVDTDQAAELRGVTRRRVQGIASEGGFPGALLVAGALLIPRESVLAWQPKQRGPAKKPKEPERPRGRPRKAAAQ